MATVDVKGSQLTVAKIGQKCTRSR